MRFLVLSSICLLAMACASPYKNLQKTEDGNVLCVQKFKPAFGNVLYKTEITIFKRNLSGLLFIKTLADSSVRMVFSAEMGFKFFDFEFSKNGQFKVMSIIDQMNKAAVINTLKRDFELILMNQNDTKRQYVQKQNNLIYNTFEQQDNINYYITDTNCSELIQIESASKRKKKVEIKMLNYKNQIPDSIGIKHDKFNFTIALKRLER